MCNQGYFTGRQAEVPSFKIKHSMETIQTEIISMPRIGDIAPDFEAVTLTGKIK